MAGPRGRDRHAAAPSPVRRRRQGTRGPPPLPPPPPTRAQERAEADRRNGGPASPPKRPLHPGCGGTTAEAGALTPCPLPADGGPAAPKTAQTERPCQRPARGRRGREPGRGGSPPPPPPPPAALIRWRPTRPRPTPAAARQPRQHEYTPGKHAGDDEWQADARRGGGLGRRPPHPSSPPAPPPQLGSHRSDPPPLRSRGGAPPPPEGTATRGGGCGWTCTPRAPAPPAAPAGVPAAGRAHTSVPKQRADQALGAAHGGAPEQYGGRAPHDPPMTTAHSGRAEGGFRSAGAPGGAVRGPPLTPPTPGAAPRPRPHAHAGREWADGTRGSGWGTAGRHPEGEQGGRGATPPPTPPTGPQAAWASAPSPQGRGDGPPSPRPREEPERGPPPRPSRRLPQEPRRTSEPAQPRQDAAQIAPSEGGRARTGVVWGATPPMDRTTPVTPALLPAKGRQRDGTRQSDPPP